MRECIGEVETGCIEEGDATQRIQVFVDFFEVLLVDADHRGHLPTSRVAREHDAVRIDANIGTVLTQPSDRGRDIVVKCRISSIARAADEPVVDAGDGVTMLRQPLRGCGNVVRFVAAAVPTAMNKRDDRRTSHPDRGVKVEARDAAIDARALRVGQCLKLGRGRSAPRRWRCERRDRVEAVRVGARSLVMKVRCIAATRRGEECERQGAAGDRTAMYGTQHPINRTGATITIVGRDLRTVVDRSSWGVAAFLCGTGRVVPRMFEHLDDLVAELDKLEGTWSEVLASGNQRLIRDAGRREKELRPLVETYLVYRSTEAEHAGARELLKGEADPEMRAFFEVEISEAQSKIEGLEAELKELLLPRDPNEGRNVILEIQGTEGGEEANLWAGDLFRMYQRFVEKHGLKLEILSGQPSDHGGYRDVTFMVKGETAWSKLKYEGGPHRVQRVPETESQGRIHTSAATVAVLTEDEDVEVEIDSNDLRIDIYRSGGPGGQSVNTTDSAVRITHMPTGLVVQCQDERSQLQNRERAMMILRARLLKYQQDIKDAALSEARRTQVKGGGRSEKIRTYNYKDNRITDHRIGLTLYSLDRVLQGELDDVVDALAGDERRRQLGGE